MNQTSNESACTSDMKAASSFHYDTSRYYINNQKRGLEVYVGGVTNKYVTLTGQVLRQMDLVDRSAELQQVLDLYMRRETTMSTRKKGEIPQLPDLQMDDAELIEKIKESNQAQKFSRLMAGDLSDYDDDHSRADLALCNILAYWTRGKAEWMDLLFRQSALFRSKWDENRGGNKYGEITIQKAISSCTAVYDPDTYFASTLDDFIVPITDEPLTLKSFYPEKNDLYRCGDIGNGRLFADWYRNVARYVKERKKWFCFNGKVWKPDTGNLKTMELCKKLADEILGYCLSLPEGYEKFKESARKWKKRTVRETILKDAASVYPAELKEFDRNPFLFNCLNGTLNVSTREFNEHSPADMLTMISGVHYDPDAISVEWEKFIDEVMQGDRDKAVYLQKALGLSLTGDTSYECGFILYGATTRNGKGTTMETYMNLVGDYGKATKPDTIAQRHQVNGCGPSEDIARLAGARFVNVSEPDKKLVLNSALVKTMTGNDTIPTRFLHENSFEFKPQFKMFINTNHLPSVTDATLFSSDRVRVIPFEKHFSEYERDKGLKSRLARPESLSGILNWCFAGYRLLKETGLNPPESVLNATDRYRIDSDKISRFIQEDMEAAFGFEVRASEAYSRYQNWCYQNGFQPGSSRTFNADIEGVLSIERRRPKDGGEKTTIICGYKIKVSYSEFLD